MKLISEYSYNEILIIFSKESLEVIQKLAIIIFEKKTKDVNESAKL